jgi:hypothetical protein
MSVSPSESKAAPEDLKELEHIPLDLQGYVDYTNWKGTKLNVVGSPDIPGFTGDVPANFKCDTVALLPNGWLPVGFMPASVQILADQHFIRDMQLKFAQGQVMPEYACGYLDLIKFEHNALNTSLYAMQCSKTIEPDRELMKGSILESIKMIRHCLPDAEIVPKGLQSLEALYTVSNFSKARSDSEMLFLADVAPALKDPIKLKNRMKVTQFVAEWAMIHGVTPTSLVFTACVSVIWSSVEFNPARNILKPKAGYTTLDAGLTLDVLRDIELYMLTIAALGTTRIAYLTRNRDLIHFWLALSPNNISHNGKTLKFELRLTGALFQEMKPVDYAEVQGLFVAAAAREVDDEIQRLPAEEQPTVAFKFDRKIDTRLEQRSAKAKIMNLLKRTKSSGD